MARNTLDTYRRKRDFSKTPEPPAEVEKGPGGRFVVHEHHASRLHYDLRIEMGGVLKSFAVPKGPSLDPAVRRLAINTEDHPVKYLTFQGSISDGQYGAGQMVIWDAGTYTVHTGDDPLRQYEQGKLHLEFHGGRLRGGFMLIRGREDRQWILFKKRDEAAEDGWEPPMILPYGARTDRPKGYEIPAEALRNLPQGKSDWSAAAPGADADAHAVYQDAPKTASKSKGVKPSPSAKPAKRAAPSTKPAPPSNKAASSKKTRSSIGNPAASALKAPSAARKAVMPATLEPMLATLADKPFTDPQWVFETKWDGWRALLRKDARGMTLTSRSGKSLDATFPELAALGESIAAKECMLDGEIVALDGKGLPRFQLLQNRLKGKRLNPGNGGGDGAGTIVFYAFDMPYYEGLDLTACPLSERKALLERVLPKPSGKDPGAALRFSPGFEGDGIKIFEESVKLGFEGVVAKLKSSPYRRGRSADWLKVKGKLRQEVVIGGYTRPRGARDYFGSLVAGLYQDGALVFTGHVGGGFNAKLLKQVQGFMTPLKSKDCPFAVVPKTNEKVQWIRPSLVAEVEFAEWTQDGIMRQPIFLGLREDKDPKACVREVMQPVERLVKAAESGTGTAAVPSATRKRTGRKAAQVGTAGGKSPAGKSRAAAKAPQVDPAAAAGGPVFTHTEKVYWPKDGYTKGDLINYYRAVSPWLLPHLKDRPLILKRYPNGIEAPPFYQHDVKTAPGFVSTVSVEEPAGMVNYALCQNEASLLWLANMGVIPQNPWLSRVPHLDRPDWIVFDLDPQEVDFPEVCGMALYLKEILDGLGLKTFPKTSGSRGIHIFVPLKPAYDFAQGLDFAQLVGALAARRKPDAFTVERSLKVRKRDRIYLDCMQNSMGKSVASVYSVREKPGATVSAALDWAELKKGVRMEAFDIRTMPKRLEKKGDLFAEVLKTKNGLEGAFKKLQKLL